MYDSFRKLESFGTRPAIISDDGRTYTFESLAAEADALARTLGRDRCLLLIEANNTPEPLIAYVGAMRAGHPVILLATNTLAKDDRIRDNYRPDAIYCLNSGHWELQINKNRAAPELHPELALLLSTSGTTGASKMVTLSRTNLQANANSIVSYLGIDSDQRPITTLPFYYSYGLSVVNSHLTAGATLLLTDRSLTEPEFWEFFGAEKATSIAGVPYSFELLERVGFEKMNLPSLQTITQAGGRLSPDLVRRYGELAGDRGWRFFVMYGQTEATARIAYMPPDRLLDYPECIGKSIPGGSLRIVDEGGNDVMDTGCWGQLVYQGPNVMMHYSYDIHDLARGPEIDFLETGDIACKNKAGFFQIVGRMNRFSKLTGLRISLDDVEIFLSQKGVRAVCAGNDEILTIGTLDQGKAGSIFDWLISRYGLSRSMLTVLELYELPLLDNGKTDYGQLLLMGKTRKREEQDLNPGAAPAEGEPAGKEPTRSVAKIYCTALNLDSVEPSDIFVKLGGDSLTYVEVSLELERLLGSLPEGWEKKTVAELDQLTTKRSSTAMMPTDVFFRALAIVMVVAQHAGFKTYGGAGFLILLAGLNMARFQSDALFNGRLAAIAKSVFLRALIPYYLILGGYQLLRGGFQWADWLLISNYFDRTDTFLQPYWFIQAFAQCIAFMGLLCCVPLIRRFAKRSPFVFGLLLLGTAVLLRTAAPVIWADMPCLPYVTPMVFYLFALGWCVFSAKTQRQKAISSLLIVVLVPMLRFSVLPIIALTLLGALMVIWVPKIKVPGFLHISISKIAAAIFYIYLLHQVPVHFFTHTLKPGWPMLATIAGVLTGIAAWQCVKILYGSSIRMSIKRLCRFGNKRSPWNALKP